jgi:exopolysaccharide production protein ExoQ
MILDNTQSSHSAGLQWAPKINTAKFMLVLVLYTFVVGSEPFAKRTNITILSDTSTPLYFVAIYGTSVILILYILFSRLRLEMIKLYSPQFYLLIAWAMLSLLWSDHFHIALIRYVRLSLVIAGAVAAVDALGPKATMDVIAKFFFAVILVDWISIPLIPQAVHLSNELDPGIIGDWRGMHTHKNVAAPLMVASSLLFFFRFSEKKSYYNLAGFLLSFGFLLGTRSKTSIGFGVLCLVISYILNNKKISRTNLSYLSVIAVSVFVALAVLYAVFDYDFIRSMLSQEYIFTERGGLWRIIFNVVGDYSFVGYGYGSFWRVGLDGVSYDYATGWHAAVFNGHNGYLDILVTLGWVGFWLGIFVHVIQPVVTFLSTPRKWNSTGNAAFMIVVFIAMHNFLESTYMMWNADTYLIWLLVACVLRHPALERTDSIV